MQITETLSQGLKRSYKITIPAKDVEAQLNARLESIGKRAKVPGFRPGKIPLPLLKQRYQSEALSEVLDACIEKGVQQTMKEKNLTPSLKPKVELNSFEEGKDVTFTLELEILPTIGEISLDNLSFEKHIVTVPAEMVTRTLEKLAKDARKTKPIQKLRKTQKGDFVILDFEGFVEDKPIKGGSGKGHSLELGSGTFIPGFEEQLIGKDKGARLEVKVTFPKDYHETVYANKPARFDVFIIDIHEADLLSIDAALATHLGFESFQAMEEWVKDKISQDYTSQSFLKIKRHVLDALADRFNFEVPHNMVELEFDNIWQQLCREVGIDVSPAANTNTNNTIDPKIFEETTGKNEEELRKEYKAIAERRVRLGLLLAEIGKRNNITITNQELMNALTARAREFPGQEQQVFDFYRNNESALATLRAPIFENKVVDHILEQAQLTEKSITPEELDKLLVFEEEEAEKKILATTKKTNKPTKKKDS